MVINNKLWLQVFLVFSLRRKQFLKHAESQVAHFYLPVQHSWHWALLQSDLGSVTWDQEVASVQLNESS